MTLSTSLAGGAVLCDGAPNLSFWTHVQPAPGPITLPYNRLVTTLDRKYGCLLLLLPAAVCCCCCCCHEVLSPVSGKLLAVA